MGALGQEGVVDGKEIDTSSMVARFTNIKTSRTLSYPKYRAGDQMEVYIENIGSFRFDVTCEGSEHILRYRNELPSINSSAWFKP